MALAFAMAGCTIEAQEASTKPFAFIDGIEFGMSKAEVKLAEGRAPDEEYNNGTVIDDSGTAIIYANCVLEFDGYEAFTGTRGYFFDGAGKLSAYGFSFDKPDPEVVDLLLRKKLGSPTIEEGKAGAEDSRYRSIWEQDNGIKIVYEAYGKITDVIVVQMSEVPDTYIIRWGE